MVDPTSYHGGPDPQTTRTAQSTSTSPIHSHFRRLSSVEVSKREESTRRAVDWGSEITPVQDGGVGLRVSPGMGAHAPRMIGPRASSFFSCSLLNPLDICGVQVELPELGGSFCVLCGAGLVGLGSDRNQKRATRTMVGPVSLLGWAWSLYYRRLAFVLCGPPIL